MTDEPQSGDRIAKVIARAGLASRRDAEAMVESLRVSVNGRTISNVAMNVTPADRIAVDGKPLPEADGARLWLYHKPAGLVTTARDEKGRETVFDTLPEELGRVMSVGRLDLTSEGLLLLTNDGGLKRQLELPTTGWLRRYRVRVNGRPEEAALERIRVGITVSDEDGTETFAPMQVVLDRQQGANAWLTVGLREGRNREIRRAMGAISLYVNRLIRVSYGPFQLGNLEPGGIEEVRPRVLKEQLGATFDGELAESRKGAAMAEDDETTPGAKPRGGKPGGKAAPRKDGPRKDSPRKDGAARPPRAAGDRLVDKGRGKPGGDKPRGKPFGKPQGDRPRSAAEAGSDRAARPARPHTGKPPVTRNDGDGSRPERGARPPRDGERKPFRKDGERPARTGEGKPRDGERKPFVKRDGARPAGDGERKPFVKRDGDRPARDGERKPFVKRDGARPAGEGERKPFVKRDGERKPFVKRDGERPARDGERKPFVKRDGDRPVRDGERKPFVKRDGERPARDGGKPERRPQAGDKPKETRGERNTRLRADTSVSLRKGGQKGRGIDKPKKPASTKRMRKPGEEKKDGGED